MSPEDLDLLLAAAESDETLVPEVLRALETSDLLLPVADGPSGKVDALVLDGVPHVVAFTSTAQLTRAGRRGPYATAPAVELAASLPPSVGLALNPGGTGFPLHPAGVAALAGGRREVPAGTRVRMGEPAEEPAALLEAIARELATTSARQARRVWAQVADAVPGLVVGVEAGPAGSAQVPTDVLEAVRRAAQADADAVVDVVSLSDGSPMSAWMLQNAEPFFQAGPASQQSGQPFTSA